MNGYRSTLGTWKDISVAPSRKALTCAIVCSRTSSILITMPCIMTDSEQPPLRLISRWKYDTGFRLISYWKRLAVASTAPL